MRLRPFHHIKSPRKVGRLATPEELRELTRLTKKLSRMTRITRRQLDESLANVEDLLAHLRENRVSREL